MSSSQKLTAVTPHPLTGYYCGCEERITCHNPAMRIYCQNAIKQTDPKLSFAAHKAYMAQDRADPVPNRMCRMCHQPLIPDELTFVESHQLLEVCRRIDEDYKHLTSWHSTLSGGAEQVISRKLFSQLGDWWKNDELRCMRAVLNTLWKAGLSGISLMIFAATHEFCKAQKIEAHNAAIRAEEMRRIAEGERCRLVEQMETRRLYNEMDRKILASRNATNPYQTTIHVAS